MHHRSLRAFLPDTANQSWVSSVVYFLWKLPLIGSRVAAIALFASVFPCFIAAHFLCSWMVLFFIAWCHKTNFMDSTVGEWLYQATVGLIWYFIWFNVVEGHTRWELFYYQAWIGLDILILCGFWFWQMQKNPPNFDLPIEPCVIPIVVMLLYFVGIVLMVIYYKFCHPDLKKQAERLVRLTSTTDDNDEVHTGFRCMGAEENPLGEDIAINKRMKNLADNFYF